MFMIMWTKNCFYTLLIYFLTSVNLLSQSKEGLQIEEEINYSAVKEHTKKCADTRSTGCMIVFKGEIIDEWYTDSIESADKVQIKTRSAVKSWVSLLTGILMEQGKIDLDDPVSKYIPKWKAGADSGITVRHLLTMTSGLKQRLVSEMRTGGLPVIQSADNQNAFAFSMPLTYSPGERWSYSNEGVQLLSPILEQAAGIPLYEFAEKYLFNTLDMKDTRLMIDDFGNTVTYAGATTTVSDFAKIGQLILNKGKWKGEQIISENTIKLFTTPIPQMKNYGYLWWIDEKTGSVAAMGSQDNVCVIFPDLDLIVVRMQKESYPDGNGNWMSPETINMLRTIVSGSGEITTQE